MTNHNVYVLIVDDKAANRRALQVSLRPLNIQVIEADSGEMALNKIIHYSFSVILMDVNMPGMDGFETAELIAHYQQNHITPIIFITAIDQPENANKGYTSGAVDYLVKPYNPDALLAKIKIFIELYKQQDRIRKSLADANAMRQQSELLIDSAGQGLISLDNDLTISFVNTMACTLLATSKSELIGQSIKHFVYREQRQEWTESDIFTAFRNDEKIHIDDTVFWNAQGQQFFVEYTLAVIRQNEKTDGAVLLFQDITQRKQAAEKIEHYARHDQLTGIYNRRIFQTFIEEKIIHSKRFNSQIALHFIDLDRFKEVNDTLGHDAGDTLLKQVVTRINTVIRDVDIFARLGGDEFGIIQCVDESSGFSAASLAQRIIDSFSLEFDLGVQSMNIGCSIGISQYPSHAATMQSLIKAADTAMYNAKDSGRNCYRFFNKKIQQNLDKQMSMVIALRTALTNNELHLVYQPQFDAQTKELVGFEALMRWQHPSFGTIEPEVFIPIAVQIGLIVKMGEWCLKEAIKQTALWEQHSNATVPVSVNISIPQIISSNFIDNIKTTLIEEKLDPSKLKLEITENALMTNPETCLSQINRLNTLGIKTYIEDFGTGYSSIGKLSSLPAQGLKINRSFIYNIHQHSHQQKTVRAIIDLAKNFDFDVIAKGVETQEELEFLLSAGCHQIQGFYFSRPLMVHHIDALITNGESLITSDNAIACSFSGKN